MPLAQWNQDPEFAALPKERKLTILNNFFDKEVADDEFRALPPVQQDQIRTNFIDQEGMTPIVTTATSTSTPEQATAERGGTQPLSREELARLALAQRVGSFDPEGAGYDYLTAQMRRMEPVLETVPPGPTRLPPPEQRMVERQPPQTLFEFEDTRSPGAKPETRAHWPSRDPATGALLKGRQHPTWGKTIEGEAAAGFETYKEGGRYYSVDTEPPSVRVQDIPGVLQGQDIYNTTEGLKQLGITLAHTPRQIATGFLMMAQGARGADVVSPGLADKFIQKSREITENRLKELGVAADDQFIPGIKLRDLVELEQNIGFSGTAAISGLGVGVPLTVATGLGGWLAGTAAAGAAAYQMSTYEITSRFLGAINEKVIEERGTPLTEQEQAKLIDAFADKAKAYGLWEAIPEAIGQATQLKIITTPLSRAATASILAKIASKPIGLYGTELLTETVTQIGQERTLFGTELAEKEEKPSFTSLGDWAQAAKEVAPQTFLLTSLMAPGASVATRKRRQVPEAPQVDPFLTRAAEGLREGRITPQALDGQLSKEEIYTLQGLVPEHAEALGALLEESEAEAEAPPAPKPGGEGYVIPSGAELEQEEIEKEMARRRHEAITPPQEPFGGRGTESGMLKPIYPLAERARRLQAEDEARAEEVKKARQAELERNLAARRQYEIDRQFPTRPPEEVSPPSSTGAVIEEPPGGPPTVSRPTPPPGGPSLENISQRLEALEQAAQAPAERTVAPQETTLPPPPAPTIPQREIARPAPVQRVGPAPNRGYSSERAAMTARKMRKLPDAAVVEDERGQWWIEVPRGTELSPRAAQEVAPPVAEAPPAPEVAPKVEVVKQPWQQTQEETAKPFNDLIIQKQEHEKSLLTKIGRKTKPTIEHHYLQGVRQDIKSWQEALSLRLKDHENEIRQALSTGELTPAEYNRLHASTYGPLETFAPEVAQAEAAKAAPTEAIAPKTEEGEKGPLYSTRTVIPGEVASLADIKEVFRGGKASVNPDGSVTVQHGRGKAVTINTVEQIADDKIAFELSHGRPRKPTERLAGSYVKGKIELDKTVGDRWVLRHEQAHWLEDFGILSPFEAETLKSRIKQLHKKQRFDKRNKAEVGGKEDRADFIADQLENPTERGTVGKIIARIRDWIDRMVNLFHRTAGGVVRDIESGRLMEREILPPEDLAGERAALLGEEPEYTTRRGPRMTMEDLEALIKSQTAEQVEQTELPAPDQEVVDTTTEVIEGLEKFHKGKRYVDKAGLSRRRGLFKKAVSYALESPEFWQDEIGQKLSYAASERRNERKHEVFNELDSAGRQHPTSEVLLALYNRGLSWRQRAKSPELLDLNKSHASPEYVLAGKIIDRNDINNKAWLDDPKTGAKGARTRLIEEGNTPEETIIAIDQFRSTMETDLDMSIEKVKEAADLYERTGYPDEADDLRKLVGQMGHLRGSYAPRIWPEGNFIVRSVDSSGQRWREAFKSKAKAEKRLKQYLEEGRKNPEGKDLEIELRGKFPDMQPTGGLDFALTTTVLDQMLVKAKETGTLSGEDAGKLRTSLLKLTADMLKAHYGRGYMIQRKEGPVTKGYFEDPMARLLIHIQRKSNSVAKTEMAKTMFDAIHGMDPSHEYYSRYMQYIRNQVKTPDSIDRAINVGKAIVAFKYLGLNPRSTMVNLTALPMTAIPAIHEYVLEGKGSIANVGVQLFKALKDSGKFMVGKELKNADEQRAMEQVRDLGYASPQLAREAMGNIENNLGQTQRGLMNTAMWMFGTSEQLNRYSTILAGYRMGRKAGLSHEEALKRARFASKRSHGEYGTATDPLWAQEGTGIRWLRMPYTFQKFPHTYVQTMYDMGFRRKNIRAFIWALAAPLVIGGGASWIGTEIAFKMIQTMMRLVGDDRDVEKMVYEEIDKEYGKRGELLARYGLLGYFGDLSGSLKVGFGVPSKMAEFAGPYGGVVEDVRQAYNYFATGQPARAVERIAPNAVRNPIQAIRELDGAVTSSGNRIWNEKGEPWIPPTAETARKLLGFRSRERAMRQTQEWEIKREEGRFAGRRNRIYAMVRAAIASGDDDLLQKAYDEIAEYNQAVGEYGKPNIPIIHKKAIIKQIRDMKRPTGKERRRLSSRSGRERDTESERAEEPLWWE